MTVGQITAKVLITLQERGLSMEQIKVASLSIVPAVLVVGGDMEANANLLCELFSRRMRHD